jgi:uncharacterized iron-regulated membrane protein
VHRWGGIASATFLVVITATGLLLQHPGWLGGGDSSPALVAWAPAPGGPLLRVSPGVLEWSRDGGATWQESPLDLVPLQPVRLVAAADGGSMWLLGHDGLLVSDAAGAVWQARYLPPVGGALVRDVAPASDQRAVLLTDQGAWTTDDGGAAWTARDDGRSARASLHGLIHRLHTGHWGGRGVRLAYDLVAVTLLALVATGLLMLACRRPRRR